jgi:hypothetical protein
MLAIIDGFTGPAQVRALPFVSTPALPLRLADVILSRSGMALPKEPIGSSWISTRASCL